MHCRSFAYSMAAPKCVELVVYCSICSHWQLLILRTSLAKRRFGVVLVVVEEMVLGGGGGGGDGQVQMGAQVVVIMARYVTRRGCHSQTHNILFVAASAVKMTRKRKRVRRNSKQR